MKVSGTSILTRKILVTRQFGSEAWHGFFRDLAITHPNFRRPLTARGLVPLPDFLAFHDELVRRFYPRGEGALFELGVESARWALVDGPLKDFVRDPEISSLVESFPKLWNRYFVETDSTSRATLTDTGVTFEVRDLPAWHPYFEHVVVGYMKEMLELYCANPVQAHRTSSGKGTAYGYLLSTDPVGAPPVAVERGKRTSVRPRTPTARELEVLRFVGAGKTNREIALILGLSPKTIQHHVAHAYDKLGIYSRAGAAFWLAEHGLAS
jgi:DNA-binding CsgD family transcriptional regulator